MTQSIPDLAHFFERYQTFSQNWEKEQLQHLQVDFSRFKTSLTEIKKEAEERDRKFASRFNIFRLLGVISDEVNTHSVFLADLLNPAGPHAQKFLFLDAFWQMCIDKYNDTDFPIPERDNHNEYWRIEREKWTNYGRLDLVISNSKLSYLLVIENKIYAPEQEDQLLRYSKWLNSQKIYFKQRAIIYLTPTGDDSCTAGDYSYFSMSYQEHIYTWLDSVQASIEASRVQESVRQYMEIIKWL